MKERGPKKKRPKVSLASARTLLREAFLGHADSVRIHQLAAALYDMAMCGDLAAAKIYLSHTLGDVRNEQAEAGSITVNFIRPDIDPGDSDPL